MDARLTSPSDWFWASETVDALVAKLCELLERGVVIADDPPWVGW